MTSEPTRILVYGVTGSGKSRLASAIGARLGLPYHSVDDLTWEPGWIAVPDEIQRSKIAAICAEDAWVLDSAYGSWIDIPLARVNLIVGLDLPRWLSLGQLIVRCVRRAIDKTPICGGNVETFRLLVARDSIIRWHFRSFKRKQQRMRQWYADPDAPPTVLLRSREAITAWLNTLPSS
jgi:adenylate kinase family enzyme